MKYIFVFLLLVVVAFSIFSQISSGYTISASVQSNVILALTAIIVLWYTWETSQIRKAEQESAQISRDRLEHSYRPIIAYAIYPHKKFTYDTRFKIKNLSELPLAARVNCNFTADGVQLDFSPSYNGSEYWNLQYMEEKTGHFSWLDLHKILGLINEEDFNEIKKCVTIETISLRVSDYIQKTFEKETDPKNKPELSMNVEIFCENERGFSTYYYPVRYDYKYQKNSWVPTLTSENTYWNYSLKPDWAENSPEPQTT